jgi:hypothetical protein
MWDVKRKEEPEGRRRKEQCTRATGACGSSADARAALEEGLAVLTRDSRPRAFGEQARWRCTYGASLVVLGLTDAAGRELRREAVRVGKAHHDSGSSDEAAALLKTAYRRPGSPW